MSDFHGTLYWIEHLDRYVARIDQTLGARRDALLAEEFDDIIEHNVLRALESAVAISEFVVMEGGQWEHVDHHVARFYLLERRGVIGAELTERLTNAMRFLTIARKEFEHLGIDYIERNAAQWSKDLAQFADEVLATFGLARIPKEDEDDWTPSSPNPE